MSDSAPPPPPPDPTDPPQGGPPVPPPQPPQPPAYQPPPQGGPAYPPPQGSPGYPPPQQGGPAGPGGYTGPSADQMKRAVTSANPLDLGIIGAGLLMFLFSLFPYYTYSVDYKGGGGVLGGGTSGGSQNAWNGFFGWFAVLAALVVAVVLVLRLLGLGLDAALARMIALGGFAAAALCVVLAFFVIPKPAGFSEGKTDLGLGASVEASTGHGIGFWLTLLVVIAGLALSVVRLGAKD